jgi:transcriptional regulator with XRE-family HTH domain
LKKTIYTPDRQTQSARLIEARESAGLTQKQVQEELGISQSELSKIEKGQRKVESLTLRKLAVLYNKPISFFFQEGTVPAEHAGYPEPMESASIEDGLMNYTSLRGDQNTIKQQIKTRRGAETFRKALISKFNSTCVVTGCTIVALLEAVAIKPYTGAAYDPANGILLRADIHTLFDLDLIGIEPETLIIRVNREAMGNGYEKLDGQKLMGCDAGGCLNKDALEYRWGVFLEKASGV